MYGILGPEISVLIGYRYYWEDVDASKLMSGMVSNDLQKIQQKTRLGKRKSMAFDHIYRDFPLILPKIHQSLRRMQSQPRVQLGCLRHGYHLQLPLALSPGSFTVRVLGVFAISPADLGLTVYRLHSHQRNLIPGSLRRHTRSGFRIKVRDVWIKLESKANHESVICPW